jgi:porin
MRIRKGHIMSSLRAVAFIAMGAAAVVTSTTGHAAASGTEGPANIEAPAKPKNTQPPPQHVLGDWAGLRTKLNHNGVNLSLEYIGQFATDVSGGRRTGGDYAQQLEFKVDFDWDKIAGLTDFTTHTDFVNRLGRNLSKDYIGDSIIQAQSVYGGGGNVAVHLAELYGEEKLASGAVDIAAGRLLVGEDFATSPLYCGFMNTAICGYPNSLAAKAGFSVFPNSTWGARIRVAPADYFYVQGGLYQVRPLAGGRSGFNWGNSGTTGTYYPIEGGYEPLFGPDQLEGHYKLGFAHDTSNYPDLLSDINGFPFAQTRNTPLEHSGRDSLYVLADQMLSRHGEGPGNGLVIMGGYVWSDEATSQFSRFSFLGLSDKGIISDRPDDSLGLLIARETISNELIATQEIEASNGIPLSKMAVGVQSDETVIETRYDISVEQGLSIMPDLQYVIHPGAARTYPDALVIGLQLKADL